MDGFHLVHESNPSTPPPPATTRTPPLPSSPSATGLPSVHPHPPQDASDLCPRPISQPTPMRIALRYHEQYFHDLNAMIKAFFEWRDLQPLEDYHAHICGDPYSSSKLFLVLDIHCKTCPDVDLSKLKLEIIKVKGYKPLCVIPTPSYELSNFN
jgi:hypothetical protein